MILYCPVNVIAVQTLDSSFTSYIQRFNCTLRQRVSRLVRQSLSFSKKLENHIAARRAFCASL